MKFNISNQSNRVLEEIKEKGPIRSSELIKNLKVSDKTIYKHLSNLKDVGIIIKDGNAPEIYYTVNNKTDSNIKPITLNDLLIEQNYIYVSPSGHLTRGLSGLNAWCIKNKFDFNKEKVRFVKTYKSMEKFKENGLIKAKKRILSQKYKVDLDQIYFSDFYTMGYFGKTKLGQLVYISKSSQNKALGIEIAGIIKPSIESLISKYDIKYIGYIPPTIDRKMQFIDVIKDTLKLTKHQIQINKFPSSTKVAQKTLKKLEDRIENAANTIIVKPTQKIDGNVLLIDDATGSGATLNEVSKKIRKLSVAKIKVIGYSIVGSYKGFDVISEV